MARSEDNRKGVENEPTPAYSGVLYGRCRHNLDDKKRFSIPREWLDSLGRPKYIFVMRDRKENCLNLIPKEEMEARLAKLRAKPLFDPVVMRANQIIGANSEQLQIDTQGRIRISDRLLNFANISKSVEMIGSYTMIRLWDPAALEGDDVDSQSALDEAMQIVDF